MGLNKDRFKKFKLSKFEIIMLILAGVFLILAIADKIIKIHAEENPVLANYNYCAFIEVSGQSAYFTDALGNKLSDIPHISTEEEEEAFNDALTDLFRYFSPSWSLVFMIDDHAAKGFYETIRDSLAVRGCGIIEVGDNIFPYNVEGFYIQQYPAGDFPAYIYKRQNIVTPSPSPTPLPSQEEYFFLNLIGYGNICFTFTCNNFNASVEQLLQDNNMLSGIMNDFDTGNIFENGPIFIKRTNDKGASLYFSGSNVIIGDWYFLGDNIVNNDLAYIKENYTPHSGSPIQLYNFTLYESSGSVVGLNCIYFVYGYSGSAYQTSFVNGGSFNVISLSENVNFPNAFTVSSYSENRPMYYVYKYGLNSEENVNPNPSPSPTAAPPTPSAPPYIQLITPPLPSPAGTIGFQDPGYPKINTGDFENELGDYEEKLQNNQALGLLAVAFGFVPLEIRSIVWLILLIGVILATIRVFLHFFS